MMKNECGIVEDLLTLYTEGMLRPDTAEFVEEHLAGCANCRSRLAELRAEPALPRLETAPLAAMRRRLEGERRRSSLLALLTAAVVLIMGAVLLQTPMFLSASQADARAFADGDTLYVSGIGLKTLCEPEMTGQDTVIRLICWDTPLDFFLRRQWACEQYTFALRDTVGAVSVYYCGGDGESVLLYGPGAEPENVASLSRQLQARSLWLAAALTAALGAAAWLLHRRDGAGRLLRLCLLPASYLAAHWLVLGTGTIELVKPFRIAPEAAFLVLAAALVYAACLLGLALWRRAHPEEQG